MPSKKRDIGIIVLTDGTRDIGIGTDGDLSSVEGMETSLDLSILTNRRANSSEVSKAQYRRGWIGDLVSNTGWLVGSTLWLYEQARLTLQIVNSIEDSARKSLTWLTDIGAASRVDAAAEIVDMQEGLVRLTIQVFIDSNIITRYFNIWIGTKGI